MPVNLYYTQKVRGFQKYSKESVEIRLKRTKHQCPYCGSAAVTVEPLRSHRIRGEPLGSCRKVVLEFTVAYYSRTSENFPQAHIVFYHFHVITLMNDKLDMVRRRITAKAVKGITVCFSA